MKPVAEQTLYEILEVPPDAPESEIVQAWERAEELYGPGSLSTYTLISPDEAAIMTAKLEEALNVLLDPAERRSYDARIRARPAAQAARADDGLPARCGPRLEPASLPPVIPPLAALSASTALGQALLLGPITESVPRAGALPVTLEIVPPLDEGTPAEDDDAAGGPTETRNGMSSAASPGSPATPNGALSLVHTDDDDEAHAPGEAALVPRESAAPSGAASEEDGVAEAVGARAQVEERTSPAASSAEQAEDRGPTPILLSRVAEEPVRPILLSTLAPIAATAEPGPWAAASTTPGPGGEGAAPAQPELVLPEGAAFTGAVLRRAREARGLSVQQICERTRISRHHLENIEAERREKLPAPVYLRGILMALAKELRLDGQKVARSYIEAAGSQAPASDR